MSTPILLLNAGSSSIKYQVIDADNEDVLASGIIQRIGQPETTAHIEKFVEFVHAAGEAGVEYAAAYQHVHALFPSLREFEDMVAGCIKAGYISITQRNGGAIVRAGKAAVPKSSARDETGRRRHGALL